MLQNPQAQDGLNYWSATGGEASSFVFHAATARERAAIPCRLTGQIMLRYQPQPRKRITCVQIELSVWKLKMQSFPWEG